MSSGHPVDLSRVGARVVIVIVAGILSPPRHCDPVSGVDENALIMVHRFGPGLCRVFFETVIECSAIIVISVVVVVKQIRF